MKKNAKNLKRVSLASAAILTAFTLPTVVCPDQSTTVHADEVTQSVQQDNKNQSVQQDSTTQSVQQDSTTQSVQQDSTTQSVQQDSTTQSVQQDGTTQSVQQDSTTQSVQQDNSNQTVQQQEYENWTEDGTHYSFTDSPTYTICGNAIWDSDRELLLGVTNEDPTTNAPEGYVLNESYKYNGKYMNVEIAKDSILADWSRYASYRMYFFTKVAPSTDTPSVDPKQDEPTKGKEITYGYEQFGKHYANYQDGYSDPYFYTDDPIFISYGQDGKVYYKPTGQESPIIYSVIPNGWELDSSNPMNNNFINYDGVTIGPTPEAHHSFFSAKVQFIRPIADTPSQGQDTPAPSQGQDTPAPSQGQDTPAPSQGQDTPAPSQGQDTPAPSQGQDTPAPSQGQDTPAPSQGQDTPAPSQGQDTPAPSRGQDTPAPSQGQDTPAPSQGQDTPAPSQGQDTPAPSQGQDTPAPSQGQDTPAPSQGQDTPAPSRGQTQPVLDKIVDTPAFKVEATNCYDSTKVTPDQVRGFLEDPGFIQQNDYEDYTAPAGYEEDPTVKGGYINHDDGIFIPASFAIRFYRPITTPAPTTPDTPNRGTDTPSHGTDTPSRGADIPNSQTEGTSRNVNTTPVVAEGQIKTIKKTVKPIEKPSSISYGNSSYVAPTSIKKDSLATQSLDNKQNDDKSSLPSTGETNTLSTILSLSGITLLLSLFGIKAYRKN